MHTQASHKKVPVLKPPGSIMATLTPHLCISTRNTSENVSRPALETQYAPRHVAGIRPEM